MKRHRGCNHPSRARSARVTHTTRSMPTTTLRIFAALAALAAPSAAAQLPMTAHLRPCCPACAAQYAVPLLSSSGDDNFVPSEGAVRALQFYKRNISPLLQPSCRFIPTCSEYGQQAFEQFDVPQAITLTAWRIVRCNPLHWPGTGFGNDVPVWPPCAYWAGDGTIRTFIDDERSRARALGELDEEPPRYDPLGLADEQEVREEEAPPPRET